MINFDTHLENRLAARETQGLLRTLQIPKQGSVDFCSNDYLGLAKSAELFQKINLESERLTIRMNGSTGSRLLTGNNDYTEETEHLLAKIFKSESSLIFNSGYSANLGVLSSIPQRHDTILYDELAHACMKDGARLSLARRLSFRHNDLTDLELKLKKNTTGRTFIAVESIYSMDGDECPLHELTTLAEKYGAIIVLDEAHSTGVTGSNGSGLAVSLGLEDRIGVRIYTFGKAMGVHGACVAGSEILKRYLINFARPFIYTTAMSPHSMIAIRYAFDHLNKNMWLQEELNNKIRYYASNTVNISDRIDSSSSIQTIIFKGNDNAKNAALELQRHNFDVRPILSPTVPSGSERLRICLHAYNSEGQILNLTRHLKTLCLKTDDNNYLADA
jgi:8-amino-7-oxononanoate synthase